MMLILDNILNEIDEEWDVPVEINHHYDMAILMKVCHQILTITDTFYRSSLQINIKKSSPITRR